MMMMMIMIAGFVDSIATPIRSWLERWDDHHKTPDMTVKEMSVDGRVECIVCLSEVGVGEKLAMLDRCKHGYHVECVEAWLKDHPHCPLCRTPVTGSDAVYLKKVCDLLTCYVILGLETMATWLAAPFSRGLQSSLSESCSYL